MLVLRCSERLYTHMMPSNAFEERDGSEILIEVDVLALTQAEGSERLRCVTSSGVNYRRVYVEYV